jgi:hypothetical protein
MSDRTALVVMRCPRLRLDRQLFPMFQARIGTLQHKANYGYTNWSIHVRGYTMLHATNQWAFASVGELALLLPALLLVTQLKE